MTSLPHDDVDPGGLLEYSVVFTDRSLNHMSQRFVGVMQDVVDVLTTTYQRMFMNGLFNLEMNLSANLRSTRYDVPTQDQDFLNRRLGGTLTEFLEPHRADIVRFASEATTAHPAVDIVVNNAGVALMGSFEEIDHAQMNWLFDINFWGVVHGTRAFLPHLKTRDEAHIVNLSSIFGIVAPPGQSAYAAAKFAVRGFSESVRHELGVAGSPVWLSVVHPGGVATAIARNARTGVGDTDNARRVAAEQASLKLRASGELAQQAREAGLLVLRPEQALPRRDAALERLIIRLMPHRFCQ